MVNDRRGNLVALQNLGVLDYTMWSIYLEGNKSIWERGVPDPWDGGVADTVEACLSPRRGLTSRIGPL